MSCDDLSCYLHNDRYILKILTDAFITIFIDIYSLLDFAKPVLYVFNHKFIYIYTLQFDSKSGSWQNINFYAIKLFLQMGVWG